MIIGKIRDGIVLDHIKAGKGMELYNILRLGELDCQVALIKNADSVKLGKKDIIKIGQRIDVNLDAIGYVDPGITVNFIEDGRLVKRTHLELPEEIAGVLKCRNPRCITTVEQELQHVFRLVDREKKIYRCIYCDANEKLF